MIFHNNPDFYPTPAEVIDRMLQDDSPAGLTILEPSAGSGNICEKLRQYGAAEVLACETDTNLQAVLRSKGVRLIASDFLTVTREQVSHVNMIVMNPPFSQGCRHILHAYEIAPAGCAIVSLVNSSNLESNYNTNYKRLQELVKMEGYSEDLGTPFAEDAERVTRCRVSLVKIWKHGEGADEFNGYFSAIDTDETGNGEQAGLMQYNVLRDIVNRYIQAVKLFDNVMEATEQINRAAEFVDYTIEQDSKTGEPRAVKHTYGALPIIFKAVTHDNNYNRIIASEINHVTYRRELQKYYWRIIFKKMNMEKYATRELREQINRFIEQRQSVPFTMHNIYRVIETVVKTNGQRMINALCEAFDTICSLSAENSTAGEKWKTNANYMVNRRFICDYITEVEYGGGMGVRLSYSSLQSKAEKMDDVTKALCYMTGREYNKIGRLYDHVYKHRNEIVWGQWFEWGFFRCRGYKKGTMHFEFIDEDVWGTFNRTVAEEYAKKRGWDLGKCSQAQSKKNRKK